MEKQSKIIFNPDVELVEFAKDFSDKYMKLNSGTYSSDGGKYRIDYLEKIRDKVTGNIIDTPARIGHKSRVIELDRESLMQWKDNSDFIFYLILWCIAKVECKECEDNDTYADIFVLGYYLTTGRSVKNMILGFLDLTNNAKNREHNTKRYRAIDKYIKEYQEKNK